MLQRYFYPRSPCGERLPWLPFISMAFFISIHALLAESDTAKNSTKERIKIFLSTLSLRRATPYCIITKSCYNNFYPRSPCGERRRMLLQAQAPRNFYPRSPCGERRHSNAFLRGVYDISIHALLAESDSKSAQNSGALLRI